MSLIRQENNKDAKVRICYDSKSNYDKLSSFACVVGGVEPKRECQYVSEKQQVACQRVRDSFPPSMLIKREGACVRVYV